jgi:hypothetical protein
MKLIIHIGVEKTGTTSIQDFLIKNEIVLNDSGFHILRLGLSANNRHMAAACMDLTKVDDFIISKNLTKKVVRQQFNKNTLEECRQKIMNLPSSIHTVIISSEHFHSRLTKHEEVSRLRDAFSDMFEDIKVVMYLRDQGALIKSLYSTKLRGGYNKSFSDFLIDCRSQDDYFDFHKLFCRWGNVFGESSIVCRIFSRERLVEGSIIKDFCDVVGIVNDKISFDAFHSNESFSEIGIILCLYLNSFISRFDGDRENKHHKRIIKRLSQRYSGSNRLMTQEQYNRVHAQYSESNSALGRILDVEPIFPKLSMPPDSSDGKYEYSLAREFVNLSRFKKINPLNDERSVWTFWLKSNFSFFKYFKRND